MNEELRIKLQKIFARLINEHEQQAYVKPILIEIDQILDQEVLSEIRSFILQPRKQIFVFKFKDQHDKFHHQLALEAQLAFFNNYALKLKNKSAINPLKIALKNASKTDHPIQIQEYYQEAHLSIQKASQNSWLNRMNPAKSWTPIYSLYGKTKFFVKPVENNPHTAFSESNIDNILIPLNINLATNIHPQLSSKDCEQLFHVNPEIIRSGLIQCTKNKSVINKLLDKQPTLAPLLSKIYLYAGVHYLEIICQALLTAQYQKRDSIQLPLEQDQTVLTQLMNPRCITQLKKISYFSLAERKWWNKLLQNHISWMNTNSDKDCTKNLEIIKNLEIFNCQFISFIQDQQLVLPENCNIIYQSSFEDAIKNIVFILQQTCSPQDQLQELNHQDFNLITACKVMRNLESPYLLVTTSMNLDQHESSSNNNENNDALSTALLELSPTFLLLIHRSLGMNWKSCFSYNTIKKQLEKILQNNLLSTTEQYKIIYALNQLLQKNTIWISNAWVLACDRLIDIITNSAEQDLDRKAICDFLMQQSLIPNPIDLDQVNVLIHTLLKTNKNKSINFDFIHALKNMQNCLTGADEGTVFFHAVKSRILQQNFVHDHQLYHAMSVFVSRYFAWKTILQSTFANIAWKPFQIILLADAELENEDDLSIFIKHYTALQKYPVLATNLLNYLAQFNFQYSFAFPKIKNINAIINFFITLTEPVENQSIEGIEAQLQALPAAIKLPDGCCFSHKDIGNIEDFLTQAFCQCFIELKEYIKIKKIREDVLLLTPFNQGNFALTKLEPFLTQIDAIFKHADAPAKSLKKIIHDISLFDQTRENVCNQHLAFSGLGGKGEHLLHYILMGKPHPENTSINFLNKKMLDTFHEITKKQIQKTCKNPTKLFYWFQRLLETKSFLFMFEEEIIQQRVIPTLNIFLHRLSEKPTIQQFWLKDVVFSSKDANKNQTIEENILEYMHKLKSFKALIDELLCWKQYLTEDTFSTFMQLLQRMKQKPTINNLHILRWLKIIKPFITDQIMLNTYLLQLMNVIDGLAEHPSTEDIEQCLASLDALYQLAQEGNLDNCFFAHFYMTTLQFSLVERKPFPMNTLRLIHSSSIKDNIKNSLLQHYMQHLSIAPDLAKHPSLPLMIQASICFLQNHPQQIDLHNRLLHPSFCKNITLFQQIISAVNRLTNDSPWIKILLLLSQDHEINSQEKIAELIAILDKIESINNSNFLAKIQKLFNFQPYPSADIIIKWLNLKSETELLDRINQFDLNPCQSLQPPPCSNTSTQAQAQAQAQTSIQQFIKEIKILYPTQVKDQEQQLQNALYDCYENLYQLLQQQEPQEQQEHIDAISFTSTRDHLQAWAQKQIQLLRMQSQNLNLDNPKHRFFLAILLEIYYRCTGLALNDTQILALITGLYEPNNALLRLKTGEGKSLVAPLLAVLCYAQGGGVYLLTANRELLQRDYEKYCQLFFNFLNIPSYIIHSNSPLILANDQAILCSTLEDIILFELRLNEDQTTVDTAKNMHIVLDECDYALLDQSSIQFKLVQKNEKESQHSWVYRWIYEFIKSNDFLNTQSEQAWDENEDAEHLRQFLLSKISEDFTKVNFIKQTSTTTLTSWISASLHALMMHQDRDFILQNTINKGKNYKIAVPLQKGFPKTGCLFSNEIHEALQARLCLAAKPEDQDSYDMTPTPKTLRSTTASTWIKSILKKQSTFQSKFIGISGTLGTPNELAELNQHYGTNAYLIGPHKQDLKITYSPQYCFTAEQSKLIIKNNIQRLTTSDMQPILIMMENIQDVKMFKAAIYEEYTAIGFIVQTITGEESYEEKEHKIKNLAGLAKTITISTAMLARGTDIDPGDHPKGLFVLQTYHEHTRGTLQIQGRAARQGKPGAWMPIYQIEPPAHWFWRLIYRLFQFYRDYYHNKSISQIHEKLEQQLQQEREWGQAVDDIYNQLIQQVYTWEKSVLTHNPVLRHRLLTLRTELNERFKVIEQTYLALEKNSIQLEKFSLAITDLQDQYACYYRQLLPITSLVENETDIHSTYDHRDYALA